MPLRPITVTAIFFILIISGVYGLYVRFSSQHSLVNVSPNHRWIGVIDMDFDHGVDMSRVLKGEDVILVIDYNNIFFQQLLQKENLEKPLTSLSRFEIADFDTNSDGVLSEQDPIYQFLRVIVFTPDGGGFALKTPAQAGIRGIKIRHLTTYGNHEVIMSDGSRRTLYEINKLGGTSIYKTRSGQIITNVPTKEVLPGL